MSCSCSQSGNSRKILALRLVSSKYMSSFFELVDSCTTYTLDALASVNSRVIDELQTRGSSSLVRTLQMVQLQKTILAIGMFSMFDAALQGEVQCEDGFKETKRILEQGNLLVIKDRFENYCRAINVLKHGYGRSYDDLVKSTQKLPFRIRQRGDEFLDEGDVWQIGTLIEVDDDFVRNCADVIREVSEAVHRSNGGYFSTGR